MTAAALQSFATAFATAAANPVPLVVVVGAAGVAIWKVASTHFSGRISALEDRLKLKDDQLTAVARDRLKDEVQRPEIPVGPLASANLTQSPPPSNVAPLPGPVAAPKPTSRVFIRNYAFTQLMDIFEGKTAIQQSSIAAPFIDKWMSIETIVENIFSRKGGITVMASYPGQAARFIFLEFNGDLGHLEMLNIGDRLAAIGRVGEIDYLTLRLLECELTSTEGPAPLEEAMPDE